jgi:hypothetical protein
VRRVALAAAATLALAGAAEARPAAGKATQQHSGEAAPQGGGEAAGQRRSGGGRSQRGGEAAGQRRSGGGRSQRGDEAAGQRPSGGNRSQRGGEAAGQRRSGGGRSQRGGEAAGQRRRGRRARPVRLGRVGSQVAGLPPGIAAAPRVPAPPPADGAPGNSAGPEQGAPPPPPPPPAPPAGSGRSVQARTDDRDPDQLKLILSRTTVLAGDVKVEFNNAFAEDPHDLVVERAATSYAFPELGPGEVDRRTLALDAGEWRLRCTIPTHAERGMTAALTVTG